MRPLWVSTMQRHNTWETACTASEEDLGDTGDAKARQQVLIMAVDAGVWARRQAA